MGRKAGTKEYKTFVQGLITEANALTFPENASINEENFVLNHDGSRERRLGFDVETNSDWQSTGFSYTSEERKTISTFVWANVANNANKSFLVVQYGTKIFFYDISEDSTNISSSYVASLTLTERVGSTGGEEYVSFASGNGILIVTGSDLKPQYVSYESPNVFNKTEINIKIRDFWGVENLNPAPGYETPNIDTRPIRLNKYHKYNLFNQGWVLSKMMKFISHHPPKIGVYPSNADIQHHGNYTNVSSGKTSWTSSEVKAMNLGTTPAPKGKYIIDAFERSSSRESESGLSGLTLDKEKGRPSVACYHSSRVFYSGIISELEGTEPRTPNYSGIIFFSPTLTNITKIGNCHQEADPTSQDISDLVATDGGTLLLPEANKILQLISTGSSIFVIADNGIWEIRSGESGFAPDDYLISKVSNIGAIGRDSIISTEMGIMYWSDTGIYMITQHEVTAEYHSSNISEQSIQTFFDSIPNQNKKNVKAFYDPSDKVVRWLYNSDISSDGINYKNRYNAELILDIRLKAFYKNKIEESEPYIASIFNTTPFNTYTAQATVTDNGVTVVDGDSEVTDTVTGFRGNTVHNKYLIFKKVFNNNTYSTGNILSEIGDILSSEYLVHTETSLGNVLSESGNTLTTELGDNLTWTEIITTEHEDHINKEVVIGYQWYLSFGEYNNLDYLDWDTENYNSYLITGHDLFEKVTSTKQVSYMSMFFNYLDNSSCKVRPRWNFSDHEDSGKWGEEFEGYKLKGLVLEDPEYNYGYSVVTTKNKLRGSGKALSLHISSSEGKPMHLLGWSLDIQGTTI